MSDNPYQSPTTPGEAPVRPPAKSLFKSLFAVLAVFGVLALLVALLLPAMRTARPAARRMQCSNNLKQIAIALQNYESEYHSLPPAYTVNAEGKPLHSWRTLILPFLEQQALYDTIDLTKPWDDPANRLAFETSIQTYRCPGTTCPAGHTTYLAVIAPNGCFRSEKPRLPSEITDAHDATLLVMEVGTKQAVHWMSPTDTSEQALRNSAALEQPSHPGGGHVAFVSGRIYFLPTERKAATLSALISIDGDDDAATADD